jgi:hypothetical protein
MNNTKFIEINKFSHLHNYSDIFFCKTDYIFQDFATISNLNHDIILITGNSDYAITDEIVNSAPKNIKSWYAQNALSNNNILHPIPLGLENSKDSTRSGHGISYPERCSLKENLINRYKDVKPIILDKIYSNFNIITNISHRSKIKEISLFSKHIDWTEEHSDLSKYFKEMSKYELILCPIGNGIDTHRLWEVLYLNRIPVTIKVGNFKLYELYKNFPIIILENIKELYDDNIMEQKYLECKSKIYDISLLDINTWINKINNK